jgi:hypothetical protein
VPGSVGSFSFTPSTRVTVWSDSAPRMNTDVVSPGPPLRATVTPGVRSRMSLRLVSWSCWICGPVSTVTDWPTWLAGMTVRLAVTTTWDTAVAAADPASSGAGAT